MEWKKVRLGRIADYVTSSIKSDHIDLDEYVTTDSMLQNKCGRVEAVNLPPNPCTLTRFQKGDVLVANIRPYLKKLWLADCDGGCSTDVLVFRAKEQHSSRFLYHVLMQDIFFDYVMNGAKGSKMPRGDKRQIMSFPVPALDLQTECRIADVLSALDCKIALNRAINHNLEAMAKQLYDYWFVQFDFPDANGRPYKSSGGEMEYGLPTNWQHGKLRDICRMYQPKTLSTNELNERYEYPVYGANGLIGHYHTYNHEDSQIAMACRGNSCGKLNRTLPKSWITGNAMVIQMLDNCVSNEFVMQALKYANIQGAITGSGQPQLTRENLERVYIVIPDKNIMVKYSKIVQPIIASQIHLITELNLLATQRDTLLPLLMNGQVSVNYD